ncbi:hypothetical protein [Ectobacillus ponti]|uniref:Uncharacterized protein n=1 Tax=Ectobacillus ponti TaxID=2961894 RepID=A0AA41X7P4_9BACI|nr:hypothetical protein [Ectobacillus ponti]MCP8968703.1 hypothetical protein [Ectobacillus ponti]
MKRTRFTVAHIDQYMHARLKQMEEEFERKLGKRVALVAYEAEDKGRE